MEEVIKLCKHIRERGVKAGVSLRPKTSVETLLPYLEYMDVCIGHEWFEPGFGGQSFMEDQLEKVRVLRKEIDERDLDVRLEIDGGINDKTAVLAVEAGCDTLVAGSYVFKNDIMKAVDSLLCLK